MLLLSLFISYLIENALVGENKGRFCNTIASVALVHTSIQSDLANADKRNSLKHRFKRNEAAKFP